MDIAIGFFRAGRQVLPGDHVVLEQSASGLVR